jgi:hypothetical protein
MTKVIVEIRGGVLVACCSTDPIDLLVIDWDRDKEGEVSRFRPIIGTDDLPSFYVEQGEKGVQDQLMKLLNDGTRI